MAKLKALRPSVGNYGRVAANGIVEVDDNEAKKLITTGRFVKANAADIEAAQKRLKAVLAGDPAAAAAAKAAAEAKAKEEAEAKVAAEAKAKEEAEAKAAAEAKAKEEAARSKASKGSDQK